MKVSDAHDSLTGMYARGVLLKMQQASLVTLLVLYSRCFEATEIFVKSTSRRTYDMITVEQEAWLQCQEEIISLIEQIDASFNETAHERLRFILYGHGGYDRDSVDRALKKMHPKLLLKVDSFERSAYCGPQNAPHS